MMLLYQDLSRKIIGAFFVVQKSLGPGLLEKNYHNALNIALQKLGLSVDYEHALPVFFDGIKVGDYFTDLLVEKKIIIEVKSVSKLTDSHKAQLLNYLRISKCRLGFLANFHHPRCEFQRFVL